jgi:transcriptional regulator with XRE-family HTH domain
MPKTPKRAGRTPKPGSRFLSAVIADNVRARRTLRHYSQDELARRMRHLGHDTWVRATVSEVERAGRSVTIDEVAGLCAALGATFPQLLDPAGVERSHDENVDMGASWVMSPDQARVWLVGRVVYALLADEQGQLGDIAAGPVGQDIEGFVMWANAANGGTK